MFQTTNQYVIYCTMNPWITPLIASPGRNFASVTTPSHFSRLIGDTQKNMGLSENRVQYPQFQWISIIFPIKMSTVFGGGIPHFQTQAYWLSFGFFYSCSLFYHEHCKQNARWSLFPNSANTLKNLASVLDHLVSNHFGALPIEYDRGTGFEFTLRKTNMACYRCDFPIKTSIQLQWISQLAMIWWHQKVRVPALLSQYPYDYPLMWGISSLLMGNHRDIPMLSH